MNIKISDYGQERERIATESEIAIFDIIKDITGRDDLRLVRKSSNYVSAIFHSWDLARFKYSPRAKWINLPMIDIGSIKRKINDPEDVRKYSDEIKQSVDEILKFTKK